ncbi:MAG: glycosyltransferase, partial [Saprospiraceae bacterium]
DGGEYKQKLHEYANSHALDKWIHWIPKLDFALLPAIYKGASLFIFPSRGEGFGIPVLEAQAVGIPVITSNCSSLKEVGGLAAALIDPTNAAELRQTIERILTDTELARIMVERGKQNLSKFDRKTATEKVLSLYQSTIALNS